MKFKFSGHFIVICSGKVTSQVTTFIWPLYFIPPVTLIMRIKIKTYNKRKISPQEEVSMGSSHLSE